MSIALLLSALMAATSVASPASAAGPIVKDGVEITILPQIGVAGAAGGVTEVGLDLEAKTADVATRLGFHSLHAIADVDCSKAANRFISAVAYDQPGMVGPGRNRNVTGQWVQPSSDSYMAAVIARVCAAPPATVAAASRPPPVVKEMAAAAPPPAAPARAAAPQAQSLPPAAPAPQAAPPPAPPPPAAPPPSPPQVVKFNGGVPVAAPAVAAPKPAPPPAPPPAAAAPPPSAPPPSAPLVVKFSGAPTGAAPPSAAPPRPKPLGDRVAQVAASANVQDAERVLRELKPLIVAPLTTKIEQAVVGGAHVFRADVVGFDTAADAKAFCRSAAQVSKTCWVRAKGDEPAPPAKPAAAKPAAAKPPAAKPSEHLR